MTVKKRPQRRLRRRATRDVRTAYDPYLDSLRREEDQARAEHERTTGQIGNIYDALADVLAPLSGRFDETAAGIQSDYNTSIGSFGSQFGQGFAPAAAIGGKVGDAAAQATAAAANAYGTVGVGGNTLLAGDRMRNAQYLSRMTAVGGLAEKDAQMEALDIKNQLLDDIRNRRLDIRGDMKSAIAQRIDELKQQRIDNRLARKQFRLNKQAQESQQELTDYLVNEFSNQGGGGGGGGKGGGGGGGQGGGGGKGGGGTSSTDNLDERPGTDGDTDTNKRRSIKELRAIVNRLEGNDISQDAAIFNIFEQEYGYPVSDGAEIKMQDGKVYVKQSPGSPWKVLNDPRAAKIRRDHNQEARRIEKLEGKIKRRRQKRGEAKQPE